MGREGKGCGANSLTEPRPPPCRHRRRQYRTPIGIASEYCHPLEYLVANTSESRRSQRSLMIRTKSVTEIPLRF
jgi:hypothetical protein